MDFTETYVKGREKILNRILRVDPKVILNSQKISTNGISGNSSMDGDIKTSLNQLKSLAITEKGKVDYQKLVGNPLYQ